MTTRLVWRTETGQKAWDCADSGLPTPYRRILDLVATPTAVAKIVRELSDYSAKQVEDWLDELETLCFVHASRIDRESLLAA